MTFAVTPLVLTPFVPFRGVLVAGGDVGERDVLVLAAIIVIIVIVTLMTIIITFIITCIIT